MGSGKEGNRVGDRDVNGNSGDKMRGEAWVEMESACPRGLCFQGGGGDGRWESGALLALINRPVPGCVAVSCSVPGPHLHSYLFPGSSPFPIPPSPLLPHLSSTPSFLNQPHSIGGWALWGALSSQLLKTLSGFVSEVCPLPWQRDVWAGDPGSCCLSLNCAGHFLGFFAFPSHSSLPWI